MQRLRRLAEQHRRQALMVIGVVAVVAFTVAQIVDPVDDFLTSNGVVTYLTLLLVIDLSVLVAGIGSDRSVVLVHRNQDASMPTLFEAADSSTGHSADLIEYAGVSTTPLVRRLRDKRVRMRILIKHPASCGAYQRRRTKTNLEALLTSVLGGHEDLAEIRCYTAPFTLRGRRIGDRFLELGWLTHDFPRDTAFGQVNPSVSVDPSTAEGAVLKQFFDKTFEDLWGHPETVDARTVISKKAVS